jgi:general secretion pathway protein E
VPHDRIRETLLRKAGLSQAQIDDALKHRTRDRPAARPGAGRQEHAVRDASACSSSPTCSASSSGRASTASACRACSSTRSRCSSRARTASIAIEDTGSLLRVATHRPLDVQPMDDLATLLDREIEAVLATRGEVANLINRAYRHKADGVDEALQDVKDTDIVSIAENIQESEDLLDANKAPVIKLVNMLLFQALKLRASDIHLQPYGDRLQVRMRIDGVLYDMESVPKPRAGSDHLPRQGHGEDGHRRAPPAAGRPRVDPHRRRRRRRAHQHGAGRRRRTRRVPHPRQDDEDLLARPDRPRTEAERTIRRYINYSHGVIFVTGPTGSGKTTTLYACLDAINAPELNILTIEDPVEYNLDGISQVQVNVKKGLTFAAGLRSFLRQDPDVMMVGEVRDNETADIAIRAALTGHLVFSTVHTNDSASTVTRLLDIGVEPYLVSSSLLLVIAQRLLRTICPNCREPVEPDQKMLYFLEDLKLTPDQFPGGKIMMHGKGCDECFRSGYSPAHRDLRGHADRHPHPGADRQQGHRQHRSSAARSNVA